MKECSMSIRSGLLTAVFTALAAPAIAQQPCLHDANESPEQSVRRRQALQATRTVNNIEANQPGWPTGVYLKHEELSWSLEVSSTSRLRVHQQQSRTHLLGTALEVS
jgi:hypothetical protein